MLLILISVYLCCPDGKPLQDPQYQVLADHSLLIAETKLYDEGIYTVQASVNGGRAAEEQVRVTVFDPQPPESEFQCYSRR